MKGVIKIKISNDWLEEDEGNLDELLKAEIVEYLKDKVEDSIDLFRSLFVTDSGKVYSRKDSYDTLLKKHNIRE